MNAADGHQRGEGEKEGEEEKLSTNELPPFFLSLPSSLLVAPNGFLFFFSAVNGTLPPFIVALTVSLSLPLRRSRIVHLRSRKEMGTEEWTSVTSRDFSQILYDERRLLADFSDVIFYYKKIFKYEVNRPSTF